MRGDDSDDIEKWFYDLKWHSKPLAEGPRVHRAAHYLPDPRQIVQPIQSEIHQLLNEIGWSGKVSKASASLDRLASSYFLQALCGLGLELKPGDRISIGSLIGQLKLLPQYHRLMARFMNFLEHASYLESAGPDAWVVCQAVARQDPKDLWQRTLSEYPAYSAELSLIARCGSKLDAVLQGKMDPLQVLFPESSITTAEHLYQDAPSFRFYNLLVQRAVARALTDLPEGRIVRILEIGGGTGGMTAYVLSCLPSHCTEYVFSDVSKLFLDKAEQKFHDYPFVRYQLLDIENDPLQQGYEPHSFDLVLASDVLHATKDLRGSLRNIAKLLSSKGLLIILEAEKLASADRAFSWIDLVFGSTPGWWNFADFDLRADYPLITSATWKRILQQAGFVDVEHVSLPSDGEQAGQIVLLTRGASIKQNSEAHGRETVLQSTPGEQGTWLIFADRRGVARKLGDLLKSHGDSCIFVSYGECFYSTNETEYQISPSSPEDMEQLIELVSEHRPPWRGAIHFWSLDAPPLGETSIDSLQLVEVLGCHSVLRFIQALEKVGKRDLSTRLVLVTTQAQPISKSVSIAQTPLIGLGRVIINELPNLHFKMVDLGTDVSATEIQSLFAEVWTDDAEEEVALRDQERFVPRLERGTLEKVAVARAANGESQTFQLGMSKSGVMDHMAWREKKRYAPGPGQVEIEVYAASLNFRDVMKALGLYPINGEEDTMLGDECAGRIVAVGEGVRKLSIGDKVVALASGSFASHVTTSAELVIHKPSHLTFEEAANMPVAFLTAYYGLHHLARIKPGERVLVHSATGGVGLAAVQIARRAGAEIFATAGSPEKREFLKSVGIEHAMDSRSLSFADQVMEMTGGRGVDIVLNALAGNAIAKGLSCLARYGRFVELGKRDIYQNSKLGLWAFRKNLSFFALDLSGFMVEKPAVMRSLLAELSGRIEDRTFWPLPHRVFPASRIVEAFRHMGQAKHIGKVVISMRDQVESLDPLEAETIAFVPDGTYLISGGFGGLGLTLARWIVEHGGRNLVLMGRSGAISEEAKKTIVQLQNRGARVAVAKADVSRAEEVATVVGEIGRTMPALKGIFHTAMVLDDGILLQLNCERFRKVMAPKMDGAWNLHTQTLNCELDFFVLVSSASALIGSPGQGNYAAANSFLDAFAHYRRSLGLPAVAINWGHLAGVGYVARHPEISELLTRMGIEGISPNRAMDALGMILRRKPTQTAVMRMDWRKISRSIPKKAQRFSSLVDESKIEEEGTEKGSRMKERLQEAKPEARQEIIETFIREQVAKVLGTSATKLDPDRSLNELGLDSLMAVELKNRIESDLALSLPTGQVMQGPSIRKISTVVLDQLDMPAPSAIVPPINRQESPQELLAQVERLSDEEVDSLLRKMTSEETQHTEEEMRG
jgi:NADPH:quinone reductase-like Zn-dependent oxidoreductase/SAM-dependent methyltransferase/acyl carrier protein